MAKKPKAHQPKGSRRAAKTSPPSSSTGGENPYFCFRYADRNSKNEWAFNPVPEDAQEIMEFVCEMAQLSWREIEAMQTGTRERHKKHHSYSITKIDSKAQADLRKRKLDEIFDDEIFRFRLSGEKRLYGFRKGRVFHVVWWDQDHQVYPT